MIWGVVVEMAVGTMCIVFGLLIWVGRKVSLLHSYHYKNVKREDMPAYTRMVGIGLILIGAGIATTGVLNIFKLALWWIPVVVGFVSGLTVFIVAQKKYNGSIMG